MKKNSKPVGMIIALAIGIPLFLCVVGFLILLIFAFFETEDETTTESQTVNIDSNYTETEDFDTWAVYCYMCGSDLESDKALASDNFQEILSAYGAHSENVTFVIEAGGSKEWHNDVFASDTLTRVVICGDEYEVVERPALANMGEADTLADFLSFCNENYRADHTMVLFWDHGGGTLDGTCYDELYDNDSLLIDEIYEAFAKSCTLSSSDPPYDIVGFDCCLMATLDVAGVLSDVSRYMIASEEVEPACGWSYADWVKVLNDNPNISPTELGETICKTYIDFCNDLEDENYYTLALLDLSKMDDVLKAYDEVGLSAINLTADDSYFYTEFARNAGVSKGFGGASESEGLCTLVDLCDFSKRIQDKIPEASVLNQAIKDMVIYNVVGPRAGEANGLSFYYFGNDSEEGLGSFMELGAGSSFKNFYSLGMTGEIETLKPYIDEELPIMYDENAGRYGVELDEKKAGLVSDVKYEMYAIYEDADELLMLGYDDEIDCDWDNGTFYECVSGYWGEIEGIPVFMDLVYACDDYNEYSVAIDIDGDEAVLKVYYDFNEENWTIGNAYYVSEDGITTRDTLNLMPGTKIGVVCYVAPISADEEFMPYILDYFTYTDDISFQTGMLEDGEYAFRFEMSDVFHNKIYSDFLFMDIENGEMSISP